MFSRLTSVPPFHYLGNGTVEQDHNLGNTQWNTNGTLSLKDLANKVLERNKSWNKSGTNPSKSVPLAAQNVPLSGTRSETDHTPRYDAFSYEFEERVAIAEYDGHQNPLQAEHIAYLGAFINLLSTLAENDPHQDWLAQKIQIALAALEAQHFPIHH